MLKKIKIDDLHERELNDVLGAQDNLGCECAKCSNGANSASLGDLIGAG